MACRCRLPDGTLSAVCMGACVKESIIRQEEDARRDPLNGFAELILAQVERLIQSKMTALQVSFQQEQFDLYKKAFIEGLKEGLAIGRGTHNEDY